MVMYLGLLGRLYRFEHEKEIEQYETLEKIKKLTGLDLREFDDAIVFKVALMVKKYLDANPIKY